MAMDLNQSFYMSEELDMDLQLPLEPADEVSLDLSLLSMGEKEDKEEKAPTNSPQKVVRKPMWKMKAPDELFADLFSSLVALKTCSACRLTFKDSDMGSHMRRCTEQASPWRRFKCHPCKKEFPRRTAMKMHIKKIHSVTGGRVMNMGNRSMKSHVSRGN